MADAPNTTLEKRTSEMSPNELMGELFTSWYAFGQGRTINEIRMNKLEAELLHRLEGSCPGTRQYS